MIELAAGLAYAHMKRDDEIIRCHACAGVLLAVRSPRLHGQPCTMPTHFCPFWRHEQHVTDGCCDHCGAAVPIVTLTPAAVAAAHERARDETATAEAVRVATA